MPTLDWIGKDKIITHHLEVPVHEFLHQYGFTVGGKQESPTDSNNMIIHGDNLIALKSLLPKYEGRVDLIYIDPPYNTGNENWVYNDNVNDPRIVKWLGKVVGKDEDDFTRHDKWLCMMYPRLQLLKKLMSHDGFIFISIDENELYHLKTICDEIFGLTNFVGQWNWFKSATPPNLSKKIKRNIEYIICYQRQKNSIRFHGVKKVSKSTDPLINGTNPVKCLTFKAGWLNVSLPDGVYPPGIYGTEAYPNILHNDLIVEDGVNVNEVTFENKFRWDQNYLQGQVDNGTLLFASNNLVISHKKADYDAETPPNLIDDSVGVDTTESAGKHQENIFGRKVFEFPKPSALIEYIASFKSNSIILDCFGGSGTTAEAILRLNNTDGGNRQFILVELADYAESITAERVKKVLQGYTTKKKTQAVLYSKRLTLRNLAKAPTFIDEAKQIAEQEAQNYSNIIGPRFTNSTIEVIGETAASEFVPPLGGAFDFYELGESIFEDGFLNPKVSEETLREYIYYSETKLPLSRKRTIEEPYFLDNNKGTSYFFYYEPEHETILSDSTLAHIVTQICKGDQYIIYADACLLSPEKLKMLNVIFKKIPREIRKF
ncbi:MAG: site-specific DNA-methyltransferase [Muribaculaceae bacterium]